MVFVFYYLLYSLKRCRVQHACSSLYFLIFQLNEEQIRNASVVPTNKTLRLQLLRRQVEIGPGETLTRHDKMRTRVMQTNILIIMTIEIMVRQQKLHHVIIIGCSQLMAAINSGVEERV